VIEVVNSTTSNPFETEPFPKVIGTQYSPSGMVNDERKPKLISKLSQGADLFNSMTSAS
jgi:hypothetical protein